MVANANLAGAAALLDAMLQHLGATPPVDDRIGVGETVTVTVTIVTTPTAPGTILDTGTVSEAAADSVASNDSASEPTTFVAAQATEVPAASFGDLLLLATCIAGLGARHLARRS